MAEWEMRRALRYGSEYVGTAPSLKDAKEHAAAEIEGHGNVGRIGLIDHAKHILYYDVHEELT